MSDQQSVELFSSWDLYDNIVRNNWMRHEEMSRCIQAATAGSKLRVLDLGCGDGAMARNGLSGCQIQKYVGVDLSQDALDHLKRSHGLGNAPEVILGDIQASIKQLPEASFDLVLASYSLHHFQAEDKRFILGEVHRVLSQDGMFLWIDIACQEHEDREGYVARIEREIRTTWNPMPPQHCQDAIHHIRNHDFPEKPSWMVRAWEDSCRSAHPSAMPNKPHRAQVQYQDPFYIALRLV